MLDGNRRFLERRLRAIAALCPLGGPWSRWTPVVLVPFALLGLTCSVPEKERITRTYDAELFSGFAAPLLGLSGDRVETERREAEERRRGE
jgi:hypothetical protein